MGGRQADESGARVSPDDDHHLAEGDLIPQDPGPALVRQSAEDPEWTRAATIAYTALWQLHDLDPDAEPESLKSARIALRRGLDASDADAETSRHQARPSLVGRGQ